MSKTRVWKTICLFATLQWLAIIVPSSAYYQISIDGYVFSMPGFNDQERRTQANAEAWCARNQSKLLEITTDNIQRLVVWFITNALNENQMTGNNIITNGKRFTSMTFTWMNGYALSSSVSTEGQEEGFINSFVYLNSAQSGFQFFADSPTTKRGYICEGSSFCAGGFTINGRCYKSYSETLSFYDARNRCTGGKGDLASFEFIVDGRGFGALNGSGLQPPSSYWIGLRRQKWTWQNSNSDAVYSQWYDGHPEFTTNPFEECLCLLPNNPIYDWKWSECDCRPTYQFVCMTAETRSTSTTTSSTSRSTANRITSTTLTTDIRTSSSSVSTLGSTSTTVEETRSTSTTASSTSSSTVNRITSTTLTTDIRTSSLNSPSSTSTLGSLSTAVLASTTPTYSSVSGRSTVEETRLSSTTSSSTPGITVNGIASTTLTTDIWTPSLNSSSSVNNSGNMSTTVLESPTPANSIVSGKSTAEDLTLPIGLGVGIGGGVLLIAVILIIVCVTIKRKGCRRKTGRHDPSSDHPDVTPESYYTTGVKNPEYDYVTLADYYSDQVPPPRGQIPPPRNQIPPPRDQIPPPSDEIPPPPEFADLTIVSSSRYPRKAEHTHMSFV